MSSLSNNNKIALSVGIGIVVVIGAGITYLLLNNQPMPIPNEPSNQNQTSSPEPSPANPAPQTPGAYKDYSSAEVAATAGKKVLFFHAPWCPQCRQLDAEIKAGSLPSGVTVFKIDYDSNQALRQKYGVTLQTTFVTIDDNGNLVKKYVAYDEPTLAALIKNGL